jgi:hypothetical protein
MTYDDEVPDEKLIKKRAENTDDQLVLLPKTENKQL